MTVAQTRLSSKSTTEAYYEYAKLNNFAPESLDLPNGLQAHWLGDKNAATTLVDFHGICWSYKVRRSNTNSS